jgi:hypothetical protein
MVAVVVRHEVVERDGEERLEDPRLDTQHGYRSASVSASMVG